MTELSTLAAQLQRSAESLGLRGGRLVPLRYGSAAGELAVCMRAVGLVDREDLEVLTVTTHPNALDRLTDELVDGGLAVGEAATVGPAHWGRLGPDRALIVAPAPSVPGLCEQLLRQSWAEDATIEASALQAIGLIGPATAGLLTDLGGPPALAGSDGRGTVATSSLGTITWLQLGDASALALVDPEDAVKAWQTMSIAGRRFGLGYVGAEAAERFETIRCQPRDRARH
jgi:hypothetical protein